MQPFDSQAQKFDELRVFTRKREQRSDLRHFIPPLGSAENQVIFVLHQNQTNRSSQLTVFYLHDGVVERFDILHPRDKRLNELRRSVQMRGLPEQTASKVHS